MNTLGAAPRERPLRVALVAGEASGDQLGAGLVRALRALHPQAEFAGIGGAAMRHAGVEAWHDCSELAVMGLAEVLRHLPRLLRLRRQLTARLLAWQPDVFVGIDAPDFVLALERRLKQAGIRTVHYVSPSVWAWRAGRAATMGQSADRVLCLFPMEPPIYAAHGIDARFVGHPLAEQLPMEPDRAAARQALAVTTDGPVLALLPGSRLGEIARLAAPFFGAATLLRQRLPALRVLVPAATPGCRSAIERALAAVPDAAAWVQVTNGQAQACMVASDAVLVASGTATLEALLAKRPMVVGYRIAPLTHALVRGLGMMKVDRYSLPNALSRALGMDGDLVRECMQADCTAEALCAALLPLFTRSDVLASVLPRYRAIHEALRRDADREAAWAVSELVGGMQR